MSSSKTEHLQLNKWESTDEFHREEFNENFAKIDAGVKGAEIAVSAALSAYQTANDKALADGLAAQTAALSSYKTTNDGAVAALGAQMLHIQTGSYVGAGTYGSGSPNKLTFDFAPKLVVVTTDAGDSLEQGTALIAGQTMSSGIGASSSSGATLKLRVSWLEKGVQWYTTSTSNSAASNQMNKSGTTYFYFAVG